MTALTLPPEDRTLSPYTGWTRAHWEAVADHLLVSLRPYFTADRSHVNLPGQTSANGADSDGLEGFARSMMLYAFRTAGEHGNDPHRFTDWYRDGLLAGTDPANPDRWPDAQQVPQAKVEAASLALSLQLTRGWLWDTLGTAAQKQVIAWFANVPAGWYPDNNWLWFRITVETFLESVGGPVDRDRVAADLKRLEEFYRADGWYADGALRAYDYYCGWAMHLYPLLWAGSAGADALGASALRPVFSGRLRKFLDDYVALIGADGMPVLEGRSLIYRFATAAPLWMGAITGQTGLAPGALRRAASGILRAFVERDAIDDNGLLPLGLLRHWPQMAQSYSGGGSPYWAAKGLVGLMLPADHPVWTQSEEPLPVEIGDVRRVIRPAGWLISGTQADGIVRVYNHGSDHAAEGDETGDSALYARFGYSSATIPPLVGDTIDSPADSTAGAVDAAGALTHRSGFSRGPIGDDGVAAYATSTAHAHWVDSSGDTGPDHGSGRTGVVTMGPVLVTASVVRGPWEVRVVHLPASETGPATIRVSGWPIAAADAPTTSAGEVVSGPLRSRLEAVRGAAEPGVHREQGTSPLGEHVAVPTLTFAGVRPGGTVAAAVRLSAADPADMPSTPALQVATTAVGTNLKITWADGAVSALTLRT